MIKILKRYQTWDRKKGKMYIAVVLDTDKKQVTKKELTEIEYKALLTDEGINGKGKVLKAVCGDCRWHRHEDIDDGYICTNPDSDYVADWTEKDDWCSHWEGKTE